MKDQSSVLPTPHPAATTEWIQSTLQPKWAGPPFFGGTGYSIDTRTLRKGDVFVALKTETRDGHDFLTSAWEKGASGAIVSDPNGELPLPQAVVACPLKALQRLAQAYRKSLTDCRFIGITGSCGKTSTKEVIGTLLGKSSDVYVSSGNFNNHLGLPLSLLGITGQKTAVLEVGISGPGEMDVLGEILQPDWTVVTTISPAHVERIGSLEDVAREKEKLAARAHDAVFLGSSCIDYQPFYRKTYPQCHWILSESKVTAQPLPGQTCMYRVRDLDADRVELTLSQGNLETFVLTKTTAGMLENIAIALVLGIKAGVDADVLRERLLSWKPTQQRGQTIRVGEWMVYADHYNANPSSMADAIDFFDRKFATVPRFWVLGGMEELGGDSQLWHRRIASALPIRDGDQVLLVGEGTFCMKEIVDSRSAGNPSLAVQNVEEAVNALSTIVPGTAIFLKGSRKHRLEVVIETLNNALLS